MTVRLGIHLAPRLHTAGRRQGVRGRGSGPPLSLGDLMTTGALMLPPTRSGNTDASTTRSFAVPRTRSSGIDDRRMVATHAAVPAG